MRDLLLTLIVFGSLPLIFVRPHYGVYMWAWLTYMTPHRLAWGFAYDFRFNYFVALVTILAMFRSGEVRKGIPFVSPVFFWILFIFWTTVTAMNALEPGAAWAEWDRFVKIQVLVVVTYILIKEKKQIITLIAIIAISIGFFGFKGGLFTLIKGGYFRVMGPEYSFIADNNTFALALNMTLPLSVYFMIESKKLIVRLGLLGHNFLCVLAIFGSYSRGGLVALISMGTVFWIFSRKKVKAIAIMVFIVPLAVSMMPDRWVNRVSPMLESLNMSFILASFPLKSLFLNDLELPMAVSEAIVMIDELGPKKGLIKDDAEILQDLSVIGRFNAWAMARALAKDRPFLGGGFGAFTQGVFDRYTPGVFRHDAHSIYFEVLAEQGYVGLFIWIFMHLTSLRCGWWVVSRCRKDPELSWSATLAKMVMLGFVGYYTAGISLGLAYYDLPYHYMSIIVILYWMAKKTFKIRNDVSHETSGERRSAMRHVFPVRLSAERSLS
ncbi:MAG: putative O-glycosylation ligase, exosortase A system-associated [Magnetococcales bacterium]|nr:putative O-glycosylation ligase, exosortase A system-associated [Magnetococcales bacterium]